MDWFLVLGLRLNLFRHKRVHTVGAYHDLRLCLPTAVRARCVVCEYRNFCADIW